MKVSVIIPVYNVEKYLPRCIKSVLDQTYQDLEIILVDDGTKDNCGIMCDEYATKDNRISVIHKENGGLSSARNSGIEIATGDAVFFLDSDDYLSTECIEKMVCLMEENDADISIIQMKYIPENQNDECAEKEIENVVVMNSEKAIEESLYQRLYTCCAPAKLYKKSAVGGIRFPVGRISEDLATCHLFLNNSERIVYSNYYGYYYRQHESSIMHVFNPKRLDALEWAKKGVSLGAGEIVLNSMDADGMKTGYDIELTRMIAEAVPVPVIASGGGGTPQHMADVLTEGKADAALIASMVHTMGYTVNGIKDDLNNLGVPVRMN